MELKNNCPYLGIPPLAGSVVVLCEKGAQLRRDLYCSVRSMKTIDLVSKGLETVVCLDTPCSLGSNF
jgi:hypothetical protein